MSLHLRRVDSSTQASPAIPGKVLKATALKQVASARDAIARAQAAADDLLEAARREAEGLAARHLREREAALARREAQLEAQLWQRAAGYANALTQEWERTMAELETQGAALLAHALSRLATELPAESRLRACVAELMTHAGAPDHGVLMVAREDEAKLVAFPGLPWPVRAGGDLAPGTVRLVCAQGTWECDVHGALSRLLEALGPVPAPAAALGPPTEPEPQPSADSI